MIGNNFGVIFLNIWLSVTVLAIVTWLVNDKFLDWF